MTRQFLTIVLALLASSTTLVQGQEIRSKFWYNEQPLLDAMNKQGLTISLKQFWEKAKHDFNYFGLRAQDGLAWEKVCPGEWGMEYFIVCRTNPQNVLYTLKTDPVSHYQWHGPKIEIGDSCSSVGGYVTVQKKRKDWKTWKYASDLKDFWGTAPYNGRDHVFWDRANCEE
jgi:hypothetical protein